MVYFKLIDEALAALVVDERTVAVVSVEADAIALAIAQEMADRPKDEEC